MWLLEYFILYLMKKFITGSELMIDGGYICK